MPVTRITNSQKQKGKYEGQLPIMPLDDKKLQSITFINKKFAIQQFRNSAKPTITNSQLSINKNALLYSLGFLSIISLNFLLKFDKVLKPHS